MDYIKAQEEAKEWSKGLIAIGNLHTRISYENVLAFAAHLDSKFVLVRNDMCHTCRVVRHCNPDTVCGCPCHKPEKAKECEHGYINQSCPKCFPLPPKVERVEDGLCWKCGCPWKFHVFHEFRAVPPVLSCPSSHTDYPEKDESIT